MIPDGDVKSAASWLVRFSGAASSEIPIRIHSSEVAPDGSPDWHPDFAKWLTTSLNEKHRDPGLRTTRAFRKLRKKAIREYEVLYRVMVLGERIEQTTQWLNERATRNGIELPPGKTKHYTINDTIVLIVSGVHKMAYWW